MDLAFVGVQLLTGLAYSMLLFLIAVGLSIIFGFMRVINLANGVFFALGGYVAYSVVQAGIGFWPALLVAGLALYALGALVERGLVRRVYGKELEQVLLTFGLAFVLTDAIKWIWGTNPLGLRAPEVLAFTVALGEINFPAYRLFVLLVGCLVAALLWYVETRTHVGQIIRAGVDDRQMVAALGINVSVVFTGVFAFGAGLAGVGGVLGGPMIGMFPDMGLALLVSSLIVVVIGGLGTWKGAFAGAIVVGMVETLGNIWFPSFSLVLVFLLMAAVLLLRPAGLFGRVAAP